MKHSFKTVAAAAALSASLVLSPLSATSLQVFAANTTTQQYIEANNRALINNDSIDPVSYVHNIQNLTGDPIQSRVTKYVEYYLDGTDSEGSQMSFPSPYKYVYDANKNQIQFAYSDGGNDDNPCVYTYQYDALNHATAYSYKYALDDTSGSGTYTNAYDGAGRLTTVHGAYNEPDEDILSVDETYAYDKYGRISDIVEVLHKKDGATVTSRNHYTYKNNRLVKVSRVSDRQWDGGVSRQTSYQYKNGRVVSATTTYPDSSAKDVYTFSYDAGGHLTVADEIDYCDNEYDYSGVSYSHWTANYGY